jgi:ribosomal protein S30
MGSLTKAGKVRGQTPKIPKTVPHRKDSPRTRARRLFVQRVVHAKPKSKRKERRNY